MISPNDYIIITESHDLGEESINSIADVKEEPEGASSRMLESQGVSIINRSENTINAEPRDQFSRELMNEGGVEIIASDDDESFL